MKQKLPSFVVASVGVILVAEYFLKLQWLSNLASELKNWGIILAAGSIVLGIVNLIVVNLKSMKSRSDPIPVWLLFAALAMFGILGIFKGTSYPLYKKLYNSTYTPMATTIFSMKIFYMVSAGYRSFVAKRAEATMMLVVSLVTLVTVVAVGEQMIPFAPTVLSWLQNVPNVAGQRGILIGAALGSLATALRTLLGYERSNIGM